MSDSDAVVPTLPELDIENRHAPEDWQELLNDIADAEDKYFELIDGETLANSEDIRFLASRLPALLSRVRELSDKLKECEAVGLERGQQIDSLAALLAERYGIHMKKKLPRDIREALDRLVRADIPSEFYAAMDALTALLTERYGVEIEPE